MGGFNVKRKQQGCRVSAPTVPVYYSPCLIPLSRPLFVQIFSHLFLVVILPQGFRPRPPFYEITVRLGKAETLQILEAEAALLLPQTLTTP